ncbi:hypothetical protein DFH09DRAFT_1143695 [Mycena vulgaris]|nr:hypothetical protein DFH09DRAFT_1143695 [Mycena vulgaris]
MTTTSSSLFFLLLCLPSLTLSPPALALATSRRSPSPPLSLFDHLWPWRRTTVARGEPSAGYFPPADAGGAMLTKVSGTFPSGLGEPLNVILAGTSTPAVLIDSEKNGGFRNFFLSIDFSGECLGQHQGTPQQANLGDGNGFLNETAVLRYNYHDAQLGTCQETIQGGNHFRYWTQNGRSANSSAVFMATSYEMPIAQGHNIIVNGYNLGRDWLVGNITGSAIDTLALTNTSTFTGTTASGGYTYATSIAYVSGLLGNTSVGVNHNDTVGINGATALDGLVAVLDVKITAAPAGTSAGWRVAPARTGMLPLLLLLGALCV